MKYLVHIQGEKYSWISITKSTLRLIDFQGCFFGRWLFVFFHFWWIAVLSSTLSLFLSAECILYAIKSVCLFILFYVFWFSQSCGSYLGWCLFHAAENTYHRNAKASLTASFSLGMLTSSSSLSSNSTFNTMPKTAQPLGTKDEHESTLVHSIAL